MCMQFCTEHVNIISCAWDAWTCTLLWVICMKEIALWIHAEISLSLWGHTSRLKSCPFYESGHSTAGTITVALWIEYQQTTLSLKRNATFLHGFFLGPRVRVMWPGVMSITPDALVHTLLQKKGNFQNVVFLLRKSVQPNCFRNIIQLVFRND